MLSEQPNLVAGIVSRGRTVMPVVVPSLELLGLLKSVLEVSLCLLQCLEVAGCVGDGVGLGGIEGGSGVVAVVGEEGRLLGGRVERVVVGELCEREEACPVVLLVGAIAAEILLQYLVHSFGLPIGLWVMRRR